MGTERIPGFCTLCRSRCGTLNTVTDGRLVKVEPNPDHPTGQAMCSKGRAAPEIAHGSNRLTTPLRRTRPKTAADPGWEPITWDAALDEVAARLQAQRMAGGAESVAFAATSPSATPISDSIEWVERFIRLFGSPNAAYSTEICNWHKDFAHAFTYGYGIATPDYPNADLILLWGHNPSSVWLSEAGAIAEGQRRGARLVVVDPRRTAHAGQSDHWLRVLPGTDAALAMGLLRELIETDGYDLDFVRSWTNAGLLVRCDDGYLVRGGEAFMAFDEVEQRVMPAQAASRPALRGAYHADGVACRPVFDLLIEACAPYTPEHVAAITSVPAAVIRQTAAAIATAKSVAYYCWTGVGQHADATQTDRAIAVLMALTGSHDKPGGNRDYARQPVNKVNPFDLLSPDQAQKALGLQRRPLGPPSQGWITAADLYSAILDRQPYAVRALMSFGANLLVSHADPLRAQAALQALEFHVHCDLIETPTARFADILLPVNSPWEREGLRIGFEINAAAEELVQLRPRMVPPVGQSRSDMQIVFELATRLGMTDDFHGGDPDAGWNHILAPLDLTVAQLRDQPGGVRRQLAQRPQRYLDRMPAFPTQTGLIELYSERFLRHGHPPLPCFTAPPEAPGESFPIVLTTAKSGYYCHSQQRGIASLRRRAPEPMVGLAPELAASRGIANGDWVTLRSRVGTARFKARIDPELHPRVAVADYGWWQSSADLGLPGYDPTNPAGSNYNAMISPEHSDPISGSVPMRSFACQVERIAAAAVPDWTAMRVAALVAEAEDCMSVTFVPEGTGVMTDYRPGQHLPIRIPDIAGHGVTTRSYSLSGAASVPGRSHYRITVKRVAEGVASHHITRVLRVGDIVWAQPPGGRFVVPLQADFPLVMLAAGIGITPFMAALESLALWSEAARAAAPRMVLHYGNRNGAGHAFRDRLRALRRLLPTLTVIDHYSQPGSLDRLGEDYDVHGRVIAACIAPELIAARARFYMCGPPAMLSGLTEGLAAIGVPRFEIFQEAFGSAITAPLAEVGDVTHQVRFSRSGQVVAWRPADGSLLDCAEANGVKAPSGCRVGQCESCAISVVAGQFRYLAEVGNDEPGICLTCRAVPTSDLVLDL